MYQQSCAISCFILCDTVTFRLLTRLTKAKLIQFVTKVYIKINYIFSYKNFLRGGKVGERHVHACHFRVWEALIVAKKSKQFQCIP